MRQTNCPTCGVMSFLSFFQARSSMSTVRKPGTKFSVIWKKKLKSSLLLITICGFRDLPQLTIKQITRFIEKN
jgi:hypothetical protein